MHLEKKREPVFKMSEEYSKLYPYSMDYKSNTYEEMPDYDELL